MTTEVENEVIEDRLKRNIRVALALRGENVPTLASGLGMGRQALYDRLSGRTPLRASDVARIADYLRFPVGKLYEDPEVTYIGSIEGVRMSPWIDVPAGQDRRRNDRRMNLALFLPGGVERRVGERRLTIPSEWLTEPDGNVMGTERLRRAS